MQENNIAEYEYDYFISFSNKDAEKVSDIVEVLDGVYGAKCWFQIKDSKAEFVDAIMEGIEKSKAFIVFISPDSANSYFVLNEINHAIEWKQENEDYKILPVVIGPEELDISDPVYKKIRFYLGRLNMLFFKKSTTPESLVLKIFEQTGFAVKDEKLHDSLYHSSEAESRRLQAQNEILRDFSKEFFDKHMKSEFLVLDVGCADGDNICMRLGGSDYKGLLGVDIENKQIEEAIKKHGSYKNRFISCDIAKDDFNNALVDYLEEQEAIGFDLIHISAVLLHLAEPVKLLRILRHYLKKNGYLFIQDEDDGANIVYPYSKFFDLAFKIWADSKESGDRCCARKIPSYLSEAGYSRITLAKCGVSNAGMDKDKQSAFWDIYFNHYLWLAADEDMFYHLPETNKLLAEYKSMYENYKKQYDEGKIFIQLGFFFYIARK